MDLPNFSNIPQYSDNNSSPVFTQTTSYILNTPKTNKSIHNSKSPFHRLKLKKSKRRECTPAYSPKFYEEKNENNIFHHYANTDIKTKIHKGNGALFETKENEYKINQRLSFDDVNSKNLFSEINTLSNIAEQPQKKKFINLIEDNFNDVNENYYGILCSQITPDTVFKTIFASNSEEEIEKKQNKNASIYPEEQSDGAFNLYTDIQKVLLNLKSKNFEQLVEMVGKIFYLIFN
jgi:hypothetical protein